MPKVSQKPAQTPPHPVLLRKAIFLDRDGVINKEVDYLHKAEDFELIEQSAEAILAINRSEFLAIVLTNQSGVARNLFSIEALENIHKTMKTLLGKKGATLDGIFFCPHHPDKTLPGGRTGFIVSCCCRKPEIGMVEAATEQFGIDLSRSFLIGDSPRDIECGKRAGLTTIAVRTGHGCKNSPVAPDYFVENLYEAVQVILNPKTSGNGGFVQK